MEQCKKEKTERGKMCGLGDGSAGKALVTKPDKVSLIPGVHENKNRKTLFFFLRHSFSG